MPSIACLSLGCFKNTVDTEKFLAQLAGRGFHLVQGAEKADALVINTCCFIDPAKEESIDAILEAVEEKKAGSYGAVAVVGCLVEIWKDDLAKEIPEVDVWLGLKDIDRLGDELSARLGEPGRKAKPVPRMAITPPHLSYLKISEGCSHSCTFCLIPRIRGPLRSRPLEEIVEEARFLEGRGVKEINIIAQDTAGYGKDKGRKDALCGLLSRLLESTSVPWYRLLYVHPENISDDLIEMIADENRILKYLDLPFQHISDKILKGMGRRQSSEDIYSLVGRLRSRIPSLALRTTLLVGFPGEDDEDFERLLEFVREVRFDWMGAFVFSPQEHTRAASLPFRVTEEVARERYEKILDAQQEINRELNMERVGAIETVLVDERMEEGGFDYMGRTAYQAYEIDGLVLLRGELRPGTFTEVKITDFMDYDLIGEKAQ